MKILFINTVNLQENGISTFILNNSIMLTHENIKVSIVAPNMVSKSLKLQIERENIELYELPMRNCSPIVYFWKLIKIIKNKNFDIVHVNGNSTTMSIELLAAFLSGVKVRIAHSHNTTTDHKRINTLLRPIFNIVVNGRIACNNAAGKWLFRKKKFIVIKNGISLDDFRFNDKKRKLYRKKIKILEKEYLIGHVGRFNNQKNQQFLINLIQKLDPKFKLLLIGNGMNFEKIKKEISDKNLKNRVFLTGAVNNTNDWLNAIDLFLLPSYFEGQPYTLIEATASGLNAVISDTISKENNIANNVKFDNIKKIDNWKKDVRNESRKNDKRDYLSSNYCNDLKKAGFDRKANSIILKNYYISLLNKNRD